MRCPGFDLCANFIIADYDLADMLTEYVEVK
jgi:hypothetical protein